MPRCRSRRDGFDTPLPALDSNHSQGEDIMLFPRKLSDAARSFGLDPSRLLLTFDKPPGDKALTALLQARGLVRIAHLQPKRRLNESDRAFWVSSKSGERIADEIIQDLQRKQSGITVRPVYHLSGATDPSALCSVGDGKLLCRIHEKTSFKELKKLLAKDDLEDVSRSDTSLGRIIQRSPKSKRTIIEHRARLLEKYAKLFHAADFDVIPMLDPRQAVPTTDEKYAPDQDNLKSSGINCEGAWDVSLGSAAVTLCYVDSGVAFDHPDLAHANHRGWDDVAGAVTNVPVIIQDMGADDAHGTAVAGIASARWDNGGVAGICEGASIYSVPVPRDGFGMITEANVTASVQIVPLTAPADLPGGGTTALRVVVISYGATVWGAAAFDTEIANLLSGGSLVISPSGNDVGGTGLGLLEYPGRHPQVIGAGAVDDAGDRAAAVVGDHFSPDWSSRYNDTVASLPSGGVSVVAPGQTIATTDLVGASGYNPNVSASYPADPDYHRNFEGTCAAAAHVAGVAALLRSVYPSLNYVAIRNIIERTARRITGSGGTLVYTDDLAKYPNGPYNPEVGYGMVDADRAVRFADVWIADNPGDTGVEPTVGNVWRDADLVIRPSSELMADVVANFDAWRDVAADSRQLDKNVTNYCYVRVRNAGPAAATNVDVRAVAASCSTGFQYPEDWFAADTGAGSLVKVFTPAPAGWVAADSVSGDFYRIANIPAGAVAYARFTMSSAEITQYQTDNGNHACSLAVALCDQDVAFKDWHDSLLPTDMIPGQQRRRNNLIQRNLNIVPATSPWFFPFFVGNLADGDEFLELIIDARLPKGAAGKLALDDRERAFPNLDLDRLDAEADRREKRCGRHDPSCAHGLTFVEPVHVKATFGCAMTHLKIPAGARLEHGFERPRFDVTDVRGGRLAIERGRRVVDLTSRSTAVRIAKRPHSVLPFYLEIPVPPGVREHQQFEVDIIQRDLGGAVIGGISLLLTP